MDVEPGIAAAAFLQLAEVRRRRGDLAGADQAYERAHELGEKPQPGMALVRLAQGKIAAARSGLATALAGPSSPPQRVRLLAAQTEIALAEGDVAAAREAADELGTIAARPRRPRRSRRRAATAGRRGRARRRTTAPPRPPPRHGDRRVAGAPAPVRERAARACCTRVRSAAAGDEDGGALELRAALATFDRLGAAPDRGATAALLGDGKALPGGLTAREAEVLRLVAAGKTNRDIAVELVISEHTVGRHLQNMYAKLGRLLPLRPPRRSRSSTA